MVVHGLSGMWALPGSGIEPVSFALAGGFFTTQPPGKPPNVILNPFVLSHCASAATLRAFLEPPAKLIPPPDLSPG